MKKCKKCGIEKDYEKFHKNKNSKDGRTNKCKECKKEESMVVKVCPVCNEEFKTTDKRTTYCSRECGGISRRNRIEISCDYCKNDFITTESAIKRAKNNYCSIKCHNSSMERKSIECKYCKKDFRPKKKSNQYCSVQCSNEHKNKMMATGKTLHNKICPICKESYKTTKKNQICCSKYCRGIQDRNRVEFNCDICGKIFSKIRAEYLKTTNHYCSRECKHKGNAKHYSGKNNPNYKHGKSDKWGYSNRNKDGYRPWRSRVLKRDNHECQICNSQYKVVVHHLDGYNWCVERRTDETNGITLCKYHHKDFHDMYGWRDNTEKQFKEYIYNIKNNIKK